MNLLDLLLFFSSISFVGAILCYSYRTYRADKLHRKQILRSIERLNSLRDQSIANYEVEGFTITLDQVYNKVENLVKRSKSHPLTNIFKDKNV